METPKPKPPVKKAVEPSKGEKPKFVRTEHLTTKPFRDNDGLRKLQNEMKKGKR